jgi:Tol biopolymer transport system component
MGEVYRARDARLGREVALKLLPSSFMADADRLARFEREARVLASLNHPNIAAIYGVEDGPTRAIVLELVDGETLADRIARGPLRVDDALAIARQIIDALDAAHERGIVHRDLKPSNIKVASDGRVKVLDFGLAKAIGDEGAPADPTESPTITAIGTRAGVLLGTAAYMSPEQARGLIVDKRTDIWAFGCVLYEMLTASRPFGRDTVSDTLAQILERDPDWSRVVPPSVVLLLQQCLQKDRRSRLRDIGDARVFLDRDVVREAVDHAPRRGGVRPKVIAAAGLAVGAIGFGALIVSMRRPATAERPPLRFAFTVRQLTNPDSIPRPSPDGRHLLTIVRDDAGVSRLWVRALNDDAGRVLPGTEQAIAAFWSADSDWIGFVAQGRIKKLRPTGGSPQTMAEASAVGFPPAWNGRGDLVFPTSNRSGLFHLKEGSRDARPLTTLDASLAENSHRYPRFLADGRHFIFTARAAMAANNAVYLGALDGGVRRLIHVESQVEEEQDDRGHTRALLYVREGTLFRHPFDGTAFTGDPVAIEEHLYHNTIGAAAGFASSRRGDVLVLRPATASGLIPTWYTREGTISARLPMGAYSVPRVSPDGRRILFDRPDQNYGNRDIWSIDAATGAAVRLISNMANDLQPVWSPSGDRIAFASDRSGQPEMRFYLKNAADPGGTETPVTNAPAGNFDLMDWSRDGKWLLLHPHAPPYTDIWIVPTEGSKAFPLMETPFLETVGRFSPDGRWVAFTSDASGRREVYVVPFAGRTVAPTEAIAVSENGGDYPAWSADRNELYFLAPDLKLHAVDAPPWKDRTPASRPLFTICAEGQPLVGATSGYSYDAARGGRFVILCQPGIPEFVAVIDRARPY